jgi:hypothetical protein
LIVNSVIIYVLKKLFFQQLVKAHKIFLAMGSPVFETMFYGGMAQANAGRSVNTGSDAIEVQDIQPFAFKDLLE